MCALLRERTQCVKVIGHVIPIVISGDGIKFNS